MLDKYLTVIDFYQETQEPLQVELAKKEFLQHKRLYNDFSFYWAFNLENEEVIQRAAEAGYLKS
jgi:hypothetical protein